MHTLWLHRYYIYRHFMCMLIYTHLHTHTYIHTHIHVCIYIHTHIDITKISIVPVYSVQFSTVAQLCLTLCDTTDCSMPGFLVHQQHQEFAHVHWVHDAIQPSHPLLSPFPPAFNLSQHQGLFQWVSSSH